METVPVPLETEVLLQDNYKRNSDLSHLEDLALKSAIDYFGDELIHWLGIQEKAVRSAPTEIVELETRHMYEDFLYEMENGNWYHFEFESDSLTVDDMKRFREYEASTARRINAPVITYVICSSKVKKIRSSISEGINTYRVRVIRLKDNDPGKILSQLEQKNINRVATGRHYTFAALTAHGREAGTEKPYYGRYPYIEKSGKLIQQKRSSKNGSHSVRFRSKILK